MLRWFDYDCTLCETSRDVFVDVPHGTKPPLAVSSECSTCGRVTKHRKIVSMPAKYTYEQDHTPEAIGGRFDTQGFRKPPPLPSLPPGKEFDEARERFHGPAYQEVRKERMDIAKQNAAKRARAKAMKKHPTMNTRTNPLPGDPKRS